MNTKLKASLVVLLLPPAVAVVVATAPMLACTTRGSGAPTIAGTINLVFEEDFGSGTLVIGKPSVCTECRRSTNETDGGLRSLHGQEPKGGPP